jgi:hypothetical protein
MAGVKLQLSTAFHPQSDGQSEAVNKVITMYLRCLAGDRPRQWLQWLRGQSTTTTPTSTPRSAQLRSRWSTAASHHPYAPTHPVRRACRRCTISGQSTTSSSYKCASGSSRRRTTTSFSMTAIIGSSSSTPVTGSGSGCCIVQ